MVVLIRSAGTLDRVSNISATVQDQLVTIMWEAPFTLNLTNNMEPDITYCVDVMDSLNNTLYSQCDINIASVTIPLNADLCQASGYTITPVNPAGNGSVATDFLNGIISKF